MHLPFTLPSILSLSLTFHHFAFAQGANIVARRAPVDGSATSVSLIQLTPDDFTQSISEGDWFIEYFSPSCGHCRQFAPTWEKLVDEGQTEFPEVHLAQVNCALYGDLCGEMAIEAYPTLMLYAFGKAVKEFKGVRDLLDIKTFIRENVPGLAEAEKEKELVITTPGLNPNGEVLSLASSDFASTLKQGPMFVKFFAPWCGHCKKLAPTWKKLAQATQNGHVTIAEVNCDEQGSLCKQHQIEGYPTLLFFGGDGKSTEFKGGRKLDQLTTFVEKAGAPPLQPLGSLEGLREKVRELNVVYLLLLRSRPSQSLLVAFKDAASPLLGQPPIFYSTSPELIDEYNVLEDSPDSWALMVLKDHDFYSPSSVFLSSSLSPSTGGGSTISRIRDPKSELSTWLRTHRLPTYLELSQDTFQQAMNAPEGPLVVIAAVSKGLKPEVEDRVINFAMLWRQKTNGSGRAKANEEASGWGNSGLGNGERVKSEAREREIIFTWMEVERWSEWLSGMYGLKVTDVTVQVDDVRVVIADHQKLIYWDHDAQGEPLRLHENLFDSIQNVVDGKLDYKQSENLIERLARHLSNGLIGAQNYIAEHMFRFLLYVAAVIFVVIWLVRRYIGSENEEYKRVERLD